MSFFDDFFSKDPKDLFTQFSPEGSKWTSVSWNFDLTNPKDRQWLIDVHKDQEEMIVWTKKENEEVSFFKNKKTVRKRRITPRLTHLKDLMNLALHSTLKEALEQNHEFMLAPVSGATTSDYQTETRALQWIQATFLTLTRALDNIRRDRSLILTAAFFSGVEPTTDTRVLRVIAFNLDIFLYMLPDSTLQIAVFNDKDSGHGNSKTPAFQQIIKVTKPQIYDEMVKLVHRIATVGEIN